MGVGVGSEDRIRRSGLEQIKMIGSDQENGEGVGSEDRIRS